MYENIEKALTDYGEELVKLYRSGLEDKDALASKSLYNTARFEVRTEAGAYEVCLHLQDYWKYLEFGTRPHWPPREAIKKWIEIKPVVPRPNKLGRIPTTNQLAFLISRKIAKKGTEPRNTLTDALKELNARYVDIIKEAARRDLRSVSIEVLAELRGVAE